MRRTVRTLVTVVVIGLTGCGTAGPSTGGSPDPRPAASGTAGPTAPATVTAPPAIAGRPAPTRTYDTGRRTLRLNRGGDRPLPVTLWYPRSGAAGPAAGRFPVVVFSHGLGAAPRDYGPLLSGWAAAGFVVAAPAYPQTSRGVREINVADVLNQPADASFVLTAVLALDRAAGDPLRGHLDTGRVGAAGHSAGGVTTVGLFTVARDTRLTGGIVLAGSSLGVGTGYTGSPAPLFFVHGGKDSVVSYASGRATYDAVPWPKAMLTLPAAGHGDSLRDTGDAAFRVVANSTTEFLRWSLYGDPAARRRLPADAARGGLGRLDDRL